MHLLLAQKGTISDEGEAVDLGQSPGEVVFLSAADTELASIAAAKRQAGVEAPDVRIASLLALRHPMSVDNYVQQTLRHARLIVVRLLGGESYWPYGLQSLHACAAEHGISLAVLPGDDRADESLAGFCTLPREDCDNLWRYLVEGGSANAGLFLAYAAALITDGDKPPAAAPLLKAGLWWPGAAGPCPELPQAAWADLSPSAPIAAICLYRALVQSGQTAPIAAMIEALSARGLRPLPVFVASLKDAVCVATLEAIFDRTPPSIVLNATGFAVSPPGATHRKGVLERHGGPVLQMVLAGSEEDVWRESPQGLSARDLAMNVALPEVDGRILARAVSFKSAGDYDDGVQANIVSHRPVDDRIGFTADLAAAWTRLSRSPPSERRVAIVMANYPNRDGRIGNGVGLDTPAGVVECLKAMRNDGYDVGSIPDDGDALMTRLMAGPTNASPLEGLVEETFSIREYKDLFGKLSINNRNTLGQSWGDPEDDPFYCSRRQAFVLPMLRLGKTRIGIQPARGYNIDPKATYHSPDLVPPHGYLAFYFHLRRQYDAHAIVHFGKHGNLEWLPGKALALSAECWPEVALGPLPHLYPFIVNDPGEGSQAKRRASAVIVDHLTPPLTRAESYGPLRDLEALVDEYYEASGGDPRRTGLLKSQILDLVRDIGLDEDAGIAEEDADQTALEKLDAYLCELKEMQIRDGLHIFGKAPEGRLLDDLVTALARIPRGSTLQDASLHRAICSDLALGVHDGNAFDPLDCDMGSPWQGGRPDILRGVSDDPWRTAGDTLERVELLATRLISGTQDCPSRWPATSAVLNDVEQRLRPSIETCGRAELDGILAGLNGQFVAPGPSGAPTRGRPDVLPTGRNFYSVDTRTVPTRTAWELGRKSAELLVTRYLQDEGDWPKSMVLTAWGTSNMRTGGDDIAQGLALIGVKPVWDGASHRVTGFEVIPPAMLGRPRIDVTLRISGFFRDAFPEQIALFDRASRAVAALDESPDDNPVAGIVKSQRDALMAEGADAQSAARRAGYRVFGSRPGAYGAGLQALIDEGGWQDKADLAEAYLVWGGYAYGAGEEGTADRPMLEERLGTVEAVVQNQDNREHDVLDSDDYYQFEGGVSAAVETLRGQAPMRYHNDHSRPERPVIRTLEEEIARIVRGRAVNPKWIAGVMRHGYKGAFEMAATVDYLFAFSATTGAVTNHHFEAVYNAYLVDDKVRDFLSAKNPDALREIAARLEEAIARDLWAPRSNSAGLFLRRLVEGATKADIRKTG